MEQNEILDYLYKFYDENVSVYTADKQTVYTGTCTKIEPMYTDSSIIGLTLTDTNDNKHLFYICNYDYVNQIWFDGNLQKTLYISYM